MSRIYKQQARNREKKSIGKIYDSFSLSSKYKKVTTMGCVNLAVMRQKIADFRHAHTPLDHPIYDPNRIQLGSKYAVYLCMSVSGLLGFVG